MRTVCVHILEILAILCQDASNCGMRIGTVLNISDGERHLTQFSRLRHYLTMIEYSEMVGDT